MEMKAVNPWSWQDAFHFSQAVETRDTGRVLFLAGQTSVDSEGRALHEGDMAAFAAARETVAARLGSLAIKPSGTLLAVAALSQPALMVEIEATAVA